MGTLIDTSSLMAAERGELDLDKMLRDSRASYGLSLIHI